jgi:hypothetical protein
MLDWITACAASCRIGPFLAEAESYRHLGRRFQPNAASADTTDLIWVAALILGPLLLLLLFKVAQRLRRNFQQHRGEALFLELCRAHGLDWRTQLQLWRLVRRFDLKPPAAVFLSAEKFAQALRDKDRSSAERQEIRNLAQTLFGNSAPALIPGNTGRETPVN